MKVNIKIIQCFFLVLCYNFQSEATTIFNNAIDSPYTKPYIPSLNAPGALAGSLGYRQGINPVNPPTFNSLGPFSSFLKRRCPLCDSSVYSYCSEKLFHDSCCCHNPNNPYDQLPAQCQYADCSFLHANSCREHQLISACCCTNYLLYRK